MTNAKTLSGPLDGLSLRSFYPQLSLVCDALKPGGPRVFLVGGALRDYYLNRHGTDLDFAVDRGALALARRLARKIKGAFVLLDDEHNSARVVKRMGGEIWTFDFTDLRAASIDKDLKLRDFTVNAQAWEIAAKKDGAVLQVERARADLKAGIVRMVSPQTFKDDPLRLLRAFSLQATLGFKMDARTLAQIRKDAHLIAHPAAERVREELFKVLSSPRAYATLLSMDKAGLLSRVLPQITVMYGVAQGGYHHLNVWEHTLEALAQIEKVIDEMSRDERMRAYLQECIGGGHTRLALLKMAVLLHDIGKPECRRKEKGRMTFHGHEHAGERITRLVCRQLKLSVKERFFLEDAVRLHLRPGYLANFKRPGEKAVFRFLRDAKDEAASLAVLALADQAATRGKWTEVSKARHHAKICHMLIRKYFELKEQKPKQRLITGDDLIKVFKLKPSELFGKILSRVEEAAALGKISTKEEALRLARTMVKG